MEGVYRRRAERPGRPYPFACFGSAEGFDLQVDGYPERQDRDQAFQELPETETEALLGEPFLGPWLFRQHGRS